MSLASYLADHKAALVHAVSVGSMLLGTLGKKEGNAGLVAGITIATAAYHIGEGLKLGGSAGIKEASDSLEDIVGTVKDFGGSVMNDAKSAASSV